MLVVPDDEIYRVDEVFLGPEKFRFPWRWTYRQWAIAVVSFLALQAIERQLGIPIGVWPLLFSGMITAWLAQISREAISWDRGLRVAAQEAHLEMRGPREDTHTVRAVLTFPRSRRARRRRRQVIAETYGSDEPEDDEGESMPSWFSQFRPRTAARDQRARSRAKNVHTHESAADPPPREDVTAGGHR